MHYGNTSSTITNSSIYSNLAYGVEIYPSATSWGHTVRTTIELSDINSNMNSGIATIEPTTYIVIDMNIDGCNINNNSGGGVLFQHPYQRFSIRRSSLLFNRGSPAVSLYYGAMDGFIEGSTIKGNDGGDCVIYASGN